ncbi:F0F1 ATP synthase subunit B [Desulfosporosinus metallidurans]|uniref:ATP synthase subunit b n=1 Tax=Desulfosporosinus metallidurans TaxID=1888891 RepID=A0A1Q8R2Y2_9FIRM|nr:F0F1 ATP synthase subunit B [Desulfosporosinus metallidurans]OLN33939.1 ATP synthase F0 sector subunit b [Desulfosporosinus metallidurans]
MGGNPIQFDYTVLATVLSFLLLVWLLSKKAWGPLMKMMEERRSNIESMLAQAENERQQAEQIKREYQEEMRKARQEAQEVIAKATKVSEARSAEILAESHVEAEKIKKSALVDIERERDRAISEVKAQVADLSVLVAEKIIRQKLDMKGQGQLIEQFIQEVGDMQ